MIRIVTGLALIVAFVAALYDGALSIAQERLVTTPLGQTWYSLHVESLNLTQVALERHIWPPLWNPGVVTILQWPTWMVFAGLAIVLGIITRIARM
jgi:hypothetical protein